MLRNDPCDSRSLAPVGFVFPGWRRSRVLDVPTGTITLLFTDIEGSTLLLQHVGEQYSRVLAQCRQMLRTAFQQSHGHEVDTQGDAFFFAFARATDAVSAAVAAQRTLASHAWPEGAVVRIRVGLHTGEPQRTAEGYVGLQVAAELSDHFTDGIYFVNLAPISDAELVVPTIAQTLGVKESPTRSTVEQLQTFLQKKLLLLVLDNFEQVVSAAPRLSDLLARCSLLKLLVTSRAVLHLSAEHEFAVPPLSLPDLNHLPDLVTLSQYEAVALFIARAQALKPEFEVSHASAPAVAEICARLDGLPLAIELAAARIKLLPPPALLARLGQRLAVLTSGGRDAPARQQTLRKTIEWSYQLLDAEEQRLFRRLSVFVGGCTLQAIEAVYAALGTQPPARPVLDGAASLLDKSLLRQTESEAEEPRFVILETIREYGREALKASGEAEVTHQAHAAYFLALAEEAERAWNGPQQAGGVARLEPEDGKLPGGMKLLLERGEAERALRLGTALWWFWYTQEHMNEGWNELSRALEDRKSGV